MHVQGLQAVLTAHGAAPVELTPTLGHPGDMGGVVASPTAHDFAAVHAPGSQVAHTACCTQGAWKTSQGVLLKRSGWNPICLRRRSHEVHPLGQSPGPLSLQPGAVIPILWAHAMCASPTPQLQECSGAETAESRKGEHETLDFLGHPESSSPTSELDKLCRLSLPSLEFKDP